MSFSAPTNWIAWDYEAKVNTVDLQMTRQEMIRDMLILAEAPTADRDLGEDPYLTSEELARVLLKLGGPRGALGDPEEEPVTPPSEPET